MSERTKLLIKFMHQPSKVTGSVCNPGIPAVFANPESRDWLHLKPGLRDYENSSKMYFLECQMTQITILAF